MPSTQGTGRAEKGLRIVDLVRGFSILAVLGVHGSPFFCPLSNPILRDLFQHFLQNGPYGVLLFFVVSGFLITRSIDRNTSGMFRPDIRGFYTRRAGRILPLLALDLLLGVAILHFLPHDAPRVHLIYSMGIEASPVLFWTSVLTFTYNWFRLLVPAYWGAAMHWGLLWSLALEEQFYLLYPFVLRWCGGPRRLWWILSGTVLAGLSWRWVMYLAFPFPWNFAAKYYVPIGVFDLMAMGVLLYLVTDRSGQWLARHRGWSSVLCVAGFLVVVAVYYFTSYSSNFDQVYVPTLLGLGLFAFLLGGIHLSFFEMKSFRYLALPGRYCYGMYLLHPTVLFLIGTLIPAWNGMVAYLFFSTITLSIAWLSYEYFETSANHALRRWLDGQRRSRAVFSSVSK